MSALAAYRGLLSNRPLGRLLFGEFVSSIGDWLYLVALLILVYRETEDPVVLGIVGAARILPYVVLSVPAGVVADRYDRRLVLLVTDLVRGAIMLVMAWLVSSDGSIAAIVALAIVATCFSSFFSPTIGAYLPSLVRDERELGPANSAWATLDNLAYVIGPAVAGILIATADLVPAFLLNAASFAVVAIVLWGLPPSNPRAERAAHEAARAQAATAEAGTAEAALDVATPPAPIVRSILRPVAGLAVLDTVAGFVFGGLGVLTVIIANVQLQGGDEATGYLNAAMGVGGMIGAVGSGALVLRRDLGPVLVLGTVVVGAGLAALGASEALAVAFVAMTVTTAGSLVAEVVSVTVFQRVVPDAIRGRAFGAMTTISTLAMAAGSLLMPVLADSFGMFQVLAIGGVAMVVAAIAAVAMVGPAMRRTPDAVERDAAPSVRPAALRRRAAGGARGGRVAAAAHRRRRGDGRRPRGRAGRAFLPHRARRVRGRPAGPGDRRAAAPAGHGPGRGVRRDRPACPRAAHGDGHGRLTDGRLLALDGPGLPGARVGRARTRLEDARHATRSADPASRRVETPRARCRLGDTSGRRQDTILDVVENVSVIEAAVAVAVGRDPDHG